MSINESESNGTWATANAVALGSAVTGQLSTSTDLDLYSVSVAAAGTLTLTFDVPTSSDYIDYFELGLFDSGGTLLSLFSTGTDKTYTVGAPAAGAYYLGVGATAYYYSSGQYRLTASHTAGSASGYESEANDTAATADALTLGSAITGQLSTSADLDVYSISVAAAGTLTLTFDVPTSSTVFNYFELGLYDSGGTLLSLFSTGEDKAYTVGAPASGTYYVGVSAAGTGPYDYNSGAYGLTVTHTAGSVNGYESEANDTAATADALTLGSAITGQIQLASDKDYFCVQTTAAGVITVSFDAPTNSSYSDYFRVTIYDASGTAVASHSTGRDIGFQAAVASAGSYYIAVEGGDYYYYDGQYALTVTASADSGGYELEPNDDFANSITSGDAIRGQVATVDDVDWFVINAAAAGTLNLNFDAPTNSAYTEYFHLWLFDESGNLLASRLTGQDLSFSAGAPEAGNYYAAVTAADYFHDTGQYALTVTLTAEAAASYESETNDTSATADSLALGTPIHGQISLGSDADYFSIALTAGGKLSVNFDAPTNSTWANYFNLYVSDQSGNVLISGGTGADTAFDLDVTDAGTYYIEVTSGDYYYDDGAYALSVDAQLQDPIPEGAIVGTVLGDSLIGTAGDDLIYGLGGNDRIDGGAGNDTVVFRTSLANLSVATIDGLTAVRGNYAAGEHAYSVSRLWDVESLNTSDGPVSLSSGLVAPGFGTTGNDVITGTGGDDFIDGLGGNDLIKGGSGSDTLALFGGSDQFSVATVAGITRISGSASANEYAGSNLKTVAVETLKFSQGASRELQTTADTVVFGSAGADKLYGGGANEAFDGQGGSDTIDGGAGTDTLAFFGRYEQFSISFPSALSPALSVAGRSGTEFADQTVIATNIESLAFTDRTVSVTNPPALVLTPAGTLVSEGGTGTSLDICLAIAPESSVTVNLSGGTQLAASLGAISFDATNWNIPQAVTVTAVDDAIYESEHTGTLTLSVSTADALYTILSPSTLNYTISDNDNATTGGVGGLLWNDQDRDGVRDTGESGLSGWTVFDDSNGNGRFDAGESSTTTDVSGNYLLGDLTAGSHTIVSSYGTGWQPTYPSNATGSATVISQVGAGGKVGVGGLTESAIPAAQAASTYDNLGTATNIAAFHADPRFANINGQGYSVVVIDTGIDLNHPYFGADSDHNGVADRIVYQYDFSGANDSNAGDGNGHGTHVAGIIGSSDATYTGIAPQANLIALKVLSDSGSGSAYDIIEAVNWVVTNFEKYNITAVNLSLGDSTFYTSPYSGYLATQFKTLADNGVVVVSASGNDYSGRQGVSYPSADPYSLSVGAVWAGNGPDVSGQDGTTDAIAYFSQRDDTESDIFAPGIWIDSAWNDGLHKVEAGTSMAAPEITGMVALAQQLAEQELGRRLGFEEIRGLFKSTGDPIIDGDNENDTVPNTGLTFYRADMQALGEAILGLKPPVSHSVVISAGNIVSDQDFGFTHSDSVQGLSADDLIAGTAYSDVMRGGDGADNINGYSGGDSIYGEAGDDLITGGADADILEGGAGSDDFVYVSAADSSLDSMDEITDFADGDQLVFDAIGGIALRSGSYTFAGSAAATVQTIRNDAGVQNNAVSFTDGARAYLYIKGASNSFDGLLIQVDDKTTPFTSAQLKGILSPAPGDTSTLAGHVYFWNEVASQGSHAAGHVLLDGVTVSANDGGTARECATAAGGAFSVTGIAASTTAVTASHTVSTADRATVTLGDALEVLKLYLGKLSNPSPYQYLASDFNADSKVTLTDALGILKSVLNQAGALAPAWVFMDEEANVSALTKDSAARPAVDAHPVGTDPSLNLVAVLRGDANGSWKPAATASYEVLPDTYFTDATAGLVGLHPDYITLGQFGL